MVLFYEPIEYVCDTLCDANSKSSPCRRIWLKFLIEHDLWPPFISPPPTSSSYSLLSCRFALATLSLTLSLSLTQVCDRTEKKKKSNGWLSIGSSQKMKKKLYKKLPCHQFLII